MNRTTFILLLALIAAPAIDLNAESRWPRFRGPGGSGRSSATNLPVKWSQTDVAWRTELQGEGVSSPSLWDEKLFLTSALKNDSAEIERRVLCLNRTNGEILWQEMAVTGTPEKNHGMNGFATPTCATDGERVVAFFGRGGMHCYDMSGTKLWSHTLGDFPGPWGIAASPIIAGNTVIQNCDAQGESYLIALDKATGRELWRTPRSEMPRGGWSTPIVMDTGSRKELILNGEFGVNSYDPETGKGLWFCKGFSGRGTPSPLFGHGLIFMLTGKRGDTFAIRPGGQGDVTKTHMAWHTPRASGRTLTSPLLIKNYLLTIDMGGNCICYDAPSGRQLWKERLSGRFSASPIAAADLAYFQSEAGKTFVIRPGEAKMTIVAENEIETQDGETFRASPVPGEGQLFTRSNRAVYCIRTRDRAPGKGQP
jgi:outer membrane protein assembly factor BamB